MPRLEFLETLHDIWNISNESNESNEVNDVRIQSLRYTCKKRARLDRVNE